MKHPLPPLAIRRVAQAHAQAAEAINRAAGQGAGYGFSPMYPLVTGGTQTSGPITGVAGPPTGIGGAGGEVILTTATFALTTATWVRLEAICSDYVLCGVAHATAHPVYFQIDGTDDATAYGFVPVWSSPGNTETRALSSTILDVVRMLPGNHTVRVIWNSEEGANDVIHNANNPLFVYQLGF